MRRLLTLVRFPPVAVAVCILATTVAAQSRRIEPIFPNPSNTLSLVYRRVRFDYQGEKSPTTPLGEVEPLVGVRYASPQWWTRGVLSALYSRPHVSADSAASAGMLDLQGIVWYDLFGRRVQRRTNLRVIVGMGGGYRRIRTVARSVGERSFNVGHFEFQGGAALASRLSSRVVLEAQSAPLVGLSTTKDATTRAIPHHWNYGCDSDVALHLERALGATLGLTVGGGLRLQRLALPARKLFPNGTTEPFRYSSVELSARAGIHW